MDYKERLIELLNSEELSSEEKERLKELFPELAVSEDERMIKELIAMVEEDWPGRSDVIAWLEKQGEKPGWSEEDELMLTSIIQTLKLTNGAAQMKIDWLKSLRPQNRWKPSPGQLECLGYAIEKAEKDFSPLTNNRIYLTLKELRRQLKELY